MAKDLFITGLDVGSSNIRALVGKVGHFGAIEVVGKGSARSRGLDQGLVVDLDEATNSISEAMEGAEKSASLKIYSVFANLTGSHLRGYNWQGMVNLSDRGRVIRTRDIHEALEHVKAISIPLDQEILHVIPQGYAVDGQDGVRSPLGMAGDRLTASAHLIISGTAHLYNLRRSIRAAGFEVEAVVSEALATSYAVLTEEEKELGAILVNLGGGTTDIIIFTRGAPWYMEVLPMGGYHLTEAISRGLRTSTEAAEDIKLRYGSVLTSMVKDDESIMVPGISGRHQRSVSCRKLSELLEPEMRRIVLGVAQSIEKSGLRDRATSGVLITGGGVLLQGTIEMAEAILGLPIKVGLVSEVQADARLLASPLYTTAVGLIRYGAELKRKELSRRNTLLGKAIGRVRDWIEEYF